MAAINFPDAPTNGQIFESGGMSWTYVAGIGWTLNSAIVEAGSGFTFIADTMPLPVNVGDTWFDSSTGASGGTSWVAVEEGPAGASEKVWVQFAPGIGGAPSYPNLPGCSLGYATSQTGIVSGAIYPVLFDTEYYDTHGFHSGSNSGITIPAGLGGRYSVGYSSQFFPQVGGTSRQGWVSINANSSQRIALSMGYASGSYAGAMSGSGTLTLVAGDYIQHNVWQDSGSPAALQGNASAGHVLEFYAYRIGD